MNRRTAICTLTLLITLVNDFAAAEARKPAQIRHRYVGTSTSGKVTFEVTEVEVSADNADETYVLIRDTELNDEWILKSQMDYDQHESRYEMSDVRGEVYVRQTATIEFDGHTRAEFLAALQSNSVLRQTINPLTTVRAGGATRTALEAEWQNRENLRLWRSEIRRAMNPGLLEAMERLRPLLSDKPFETFQPLFEVVLYSSRTSDMAVKIRAAAPDCAFDDSFGFPCTDHQKKRIADAVKAGATLTKY